MSRRKYPSPPDDLSERARWIWLRGIKAGCRSVGAIAVLTEAVRALDRADGCREVVTREGLVLVTEKTGRAHAHPLLRVEKENRAAFAHLMKQLRLDYDALADEARPRPHTLRPWEQPYTADRS